VSETLVSAFQNPGGRDSGSDEGQVFGNQACNITIKEADGDVAGREPQQRPEPCGETHTSGSQRAGG